MSNKISYSDELKKTVEKSKALNASREGVLNELKSLGRAFKEVLEESEEISINCDIVDMPLLPSAVSEGVSESKAVYLTLQVGKESKINILLCRFPPNGGCYPCEIKFEERSVICDKIASVKRALIDAAKSRFSSILDLIEKVKNPESEKMPTQGPELVQPSDRNPIVNSQS